jgi:hypothetical protein
MSFPAWQFVDHDLDIENIVSVKDLQKLQNKANISDCLTEYYQIMKSCDPTHINPSLLLSAAQNHQSTYWIVMASTFVVFLIRVTKIWAVRFWNLLNFYSV